MSIIDKYFPNERSNSSRMYLLNVIDSEMKQRKDAKQFFYHKEKNLIQDFKIEFQETFYSRQEEPAKLKIKNIKNNTNDDSSDFLKTKQNTACTLRCFSTNRNSYINLKSQNEVLKNYCNSLKSTSVVKNANKLKKRQKTYLIPNKLIEQLKNTLKNRKLLKTKSICLGNLCINFHS